MYSRLMLEWVTRVTGSSLRMFLFFKTNNPKDTSSPSDINEIEGDVTY